MFPGAAPASLWAQLTPPFTPLPMPNQHESAAHTTFFAGTAHDGDDARFFSSHGVADTASADVFWTDGGDPIRPTTTAHSEVTRHDGDGGAHIIAPVTEEYAEHALTLCGHYIEPPCHLECPPPPIGADSWIDQTHTASTHLHEQPSRVTPLDWKQDTSSSSFPFHRSFIPPLSPSPLSPSSSSAPFVPRSSASATSDSTHKIVRVASKACVSCRRLKASCDDVRPCLRCVRARRECIDQPTEERRRPKRSAAMTAPHIHDPTPTLDPSDHSHSAALPTTDAAGAISTAALDAHSHQLCSRAFLAVAHDLDLRNTMLRTHAQVMAMKPPISALVEWHVQTTLSCLQLTEMFSPDDFQTFLVGGLTADELRAPNWLSSPLAPWAKLSTRPLHFTFQPDTTRMKEHLQGVSATNDATMNDETQQVRGARPEDGAVEVRMEWLPSAHASFQRWRNSLEARLRYEQQLQESRDLMLVGQTDGDQKDATGAGVAASTADRRNDHVPSVDDEFGDLMDRFITLGISRSLSVPPPPTTAYDRVYSVHARWCPLGAPNAPRDHADSKVKRTTGMGSVHSPAAGGSSSSALPNFHLDSHSDPDCCCTNSSPLPLRVTVTAEFSRIFGWRPIDVECGIQQEGLAWNRRWCPPSQWLTAHRSLLLLCSPSVGHLLGPDASEADARRHRDAEAMTDHPHVCLTRTGDTVMAASRSLRVTSSDGVRESSSLVICWRMQTSATERGYATPP